MTVPKTPSASAPSHELEQTPKTSFNRTLEYFIDSLLGSSPATRNAYYRDLLQFKLYLVLHRPDTICRGSLERIPDLEAELERSRGRLVDTRRFRQQATQEIRSLAILDEFDCDLSLVDKHVIVNYFGYLETMRGAKRSTLARRLSSLRRFFRLLAKEGYSVDAGALEKLLDLEMRPERALPVFLADDEARDFLSVIDDLRDRAIVLVMLFMGLRIAEVTRLNVDDITDLTDGITFQGKGAKERYVPVHPVVREAVLAYKAAGRRPAQADAEGEPLFVSQHGRRMDPSTVRRMIKKYAARVESLESHKRRRLSPHKLRHTFATLLLQSDVDIRHIQELLGHEHLTTTQIYTSVLRQDLDRAIQRHPLGDDPTGGH